MAKELKADVEVVEISALLHDYASVINYDLYEDHHIHGASEAEKILKEFNYPLKKIEQVKDCIISHRGSKVKSKKSQEALCVADADSMAHFDSIGSLYYLAFLLQRIRTGRSEPIGESRWGAGGTPTLPRATNPLCAGEA